jgi:hypothetical protein
VSTIDQQPMQPITARAGFTVEAQDGCQKSPSCRTSPSPCAHPTRHRLASLDAVTFAWSLKYRPLKATEVASPNGSVGSLMLSTH